MCFGDSGGALWSSKKESGENIHVVVGIAKQATCGKVDVVTKVAHKDVLQFIDKYWKK